MNVNWVSHELEVSVFKMQSACLVKARMNTENAQISANQEPTITKATAWTGAPKAQS